MQQSPGMEPTPDRQTLEWLLDSDVSLQYQVRRDLLGTERPDLQQRSLTEGWGARFLACRGSNGHWGLGFYQPKWISSHYTLLDLRCIELPRDTPQCAETIGLILREAKGRDGGINPSGSVSQSDVCINGMFLNYACYFAAEEEALHPVIDFVISQQLSDGGFNCRFNRSGALHSSLHSTLSVLEGLLEYERQGYTYRLGELQRIGEEAREFLLLHRLYKSHRTGETIDPRMLLLSYPSRWRYDILRALDYFRLAGIPYDGRMAPALEVLLAKRRDGRWPLQGRHPGKVHFDMEKPGGPGRWNTLRALRVLQHMGGGKE